MATRFPSGRRLRAVRAESIRAHNRAIVLGLVWWERRISRAAIARRTSLSRSTVTKIVDELCRTGLLRDAGVGRSLGGKPPKLLGFRDDAYGILGVEIGAAHVRAVLTNLRGRVVHDRQVEHDVRGDPAGTLERLFRLVVDAARHRQRGMRRVVGLGVAVPTPLDPFRPHAEPPWSWPEWTDLRLSDALEERFDVPVVVDDGANLGALAEHWWGAGRDGDDLAFIRLGTGIDCGIVIDGEIHRGAASLADEIGHVPAGPACDCGRPDCLASAVSNLVTLVDPATIVLAGDASHELVPLSTALVGRGPWASDAKPKVVVSTLGTVGVALGAATAVLSRALKEPDRFEDEVRA